MKRSSAWLFYFVLVSRIAIIYCQDGMLDSEDPLYASNSELGGSLYNSLAFPLGRATKETSELKEYFPTGTAVKETSSSFELESIEPLPSSSSLAIILSTETLTSQESITVYSTIYEYPDATETFTVTETDTSYEFSFDPGSVFISTDAPEPQSTITLTAYAQDYVLSEIAVTPSISTSTEYITATTTVEPIDEQQSSTIFTTVTTTLTDTTTVTESTQASNIISTTTNDYYITGTSTEIETSLQTEVLWTQTLFDITSTEVYTMRSLDRFQPYFLSSTTVYSTAIQTVYTTTTTQAAAPPANDPAPTTQEQAPPAVTTTSTTTDDGDPCAGNKFYRLNQIC